MNTFASTALIADFDLPLVSSRKVEETPVASVSADQCGDAIHDERASVSGVREFDGFDWLADADDEAASLADSDWDDGQSQLAHQAAYAQQRRRDPSGAARYAFGEDPDGSGRGSYIPEKLA